MQNDRAASLPMPEAPARKPRDCTHDKLRRLMRRLAAHYDARLRAAGLKTTQYSLLARVVYLGPVRPGALALAMGVDASTLTRNLRPLVDAGWVTLEAGADARSRLVHITDAGRDKRAQAQRCWKVAQLSLNDTLGAERVNALHALVDDSLALLASMQEKQEHGDDE